MEEWHLVYFPGFLNLSACLRLTREPGGILRHIHKLDAVFSDVTTKYQGGICFCSLASFFFFFEVKSCDVSSHAWSDPPWTEVKLCKISKAGAGVEIMVARSAKWRLNPLYVSILESNVLCLILMWWLLGEKLPDLCLTLPVLLTTRQSYIREPQST